MEKVKPTVFIYAHILKDCQQGMGRSMTKRFKESMDNLERQGLIKGQHVLSDYESKYGTVKTTRQEVNDWLIALRKKI
jgi:hypothetical protein